MERDSDVPVSDEEKLSQLINLIFKSLTETERTFGVSDLTRVIELKRKLAPQDDRERTFWNMIQDIRSDKLPDGGAKSRPQNTRSRNRKKTDA